MSIQHPAIVIILGLAFVAPAEAEEGTQPAAFADVEQLQTLCEELFEDLERDFEEELLVRDLEEFRRTDDVLALYKRIYLGEPEIEWTKLTPDAYLTFIGIADLSFRYAWEGRADFLEALMLGALGSYGRTVEGSEFANKDLWKILTERPQLTLDVLSRLPKDAREELLRSVYYEPVHDGFDFAKIVAGLEAATVPKRLKKSEVEKIRETARQLSGFVSEPK